MTEECIAEAVEIMSAVISKTASIIGEYIDSLERYQKYEIMHPKKKPRGSIRRAKNADVTDMNVGKMEEEEDEED